MGALPSGNRNDTKIAHRRTGVDHWVPSPEYRFIASLTSRWWCGQTATTIAQSYHCWAWDCCMSSSAESQRCTFHSLDGIEQTCWTGRLEANIDLHIVCVDMVAMLPDDSSDWLVWKTAEVDPEVWPGRWAYTECRSCFNMISIVMQFSTESCLQRQRWSIGWQFLSTWRGVSPLLQRLGLHLTFSRFPPNQESSCPNV